jgi:hypothetical protein
MSIDSDAHEIARYLIRHYGRDVRQRVADIIDEHRKMGHDGDVATWSEIGKAVARILAGGNAP